MAITAETRKSIIDLVVGATGAAPGTILLSELVAESEAGKSLAEITEILTASTAFTSVYPTFQTAGEFGEEFLTNLIPGVAADALAEGVTIVEGLIAGGSSRADVVRIAVEYLAALPEDDAALGTSAALFNNKVEAATYYTLTLEQAAVGTVDALASITADQATVTAANTAADGSAATASGNIFTLTTAIDSTPATTNTVNGIIDQAGVAGNTTWGLSDTITTASGGTMNLTLLSSASGATAGYNTTGVTTLNVKSVDQLTAAAANSFSLSGFAGLTTLKLAGASVAGSTDDNLTFNTLAKTTKVIVDTNDTDQDFTLSGSWTGAADALDLTVIGRSGDINLATGLETLNITGGAGGRLASLKSDTTDTVTSVVVTGSDFRADSMDATIKTFDASAATGAIRVTLTTGSTLTSAKAGAGTSDYITVGSLASTNVLEGWEKLGMNAGGTFNLGTAVGVTELNLGNASGTATVTNAAATQGSYEVTGLASSTAGRTVGSLNHTFKDGTGIADSLSFNIHNFGVATTGTIALGTITANAVENITIAANNAKAVTLTGITQTATGTGGIAITASGTSNLTLGAVNLSGAVATAVNTVDLSAVTGKTTAVFTNAMNATVNGGSGVDTHTTGVVGNLLTQTYNTNAGDDIVNVVAVATTGTLAVNTGEGDDTIFLNGIVATGNTFNIDGGAGSGDAIRFVASDQFIDSLVGVEKLINIDTGTNTIAGSSVAANNSVEITQLVATVTAFTATAGQAVSLAGVTAIGTVAAAQLTLTGSTGAETLTGSSTLGTTITGAAGNDTITGGKALDLINAGTGADTINPGVDTIADVITQANGDSIAPSATTLAGANIAAADTITFANGVDVINGFVPATDTIDTTTAGAAITGIGVAAATLTANKTLFLSGAYVSSTGVFTIAADGTGADTLILDTVDTALTTNDTAIVLVGVDSDDLLAGTFV